MITIKEQIEYCDAIPTKIRKNNPQTAVLYNEICKFTSFLVDSAKIKERIYNITQGITTKSLCCCGNVLKFKGPANGYQTFCSVVCSSNSKTTMEKRKNTCVINNGVEYPAQALTIQQQMQNTTNARHGVKFSQQSPTIKSKTQTSNLKKYGDAKFTKSKYFKDKIQQTFNNRYEGRMPTQSHINVDSWSILNSVDKISELNKTQNIVQMAEQLGVSVSLVSRYFKKYDIPLKSHFNNSKPEQELQQFISNLGVDSSFNNRHIIGPKELDIVIPTHNIAIEFCGLYWHSDVHDRITTDYHLLKTEQCEDKGIQLLTFFEDEWYEKRDIIENMIKYKLHMMPTLYARKCDIVSVTPKEKKIFMDKYHIQGNGRGSITYGLIFEHELVACVTFIKHKDGVFELNRYASRDAVVGGFSKMLKHFTSHNEWNKITSYADKRFSKGDIYTKNGFYLANTSIPAYSYIVGKKRFHRRRFMKQFLPKLLPRYDESLTEKDNIDNNNIHRIWDCGQLRFELDNTSKLDNVD